MASGFAYRPALDGMRAVAVAAVFVYHADSRWLPGGFLGVDVFFVLSGFLICSLLIIEHGTTGTIALKSFWLRRARRLLPAVLLLLVVIAVVESSISDLITTRVARREELLATAAYVANWFSVFSGRSYFAEYVDASPVRHTWSLAIEEQFYLIFPLVIFAGLAYLGRRRLPVLLAAVAAGSAFLMAVLFDPAAPSRAYYGTDTRIHQLLVGALLAFALQSAAASRVVRVAKPLTVPALLGLLAGFALVTDQAAFYYRGGAVVIALLTVVVVAGLEARPAVGDVLAWRPFVFIGVISYGVYLWHWPMLQWLRRGFGPGAGSLAIAAAGAVATLTVAWVSYRVVERPIRTGKLGTWDLTPARSWALLGTSFAAVLLIIPLSLPGDRPEWADTGADPVAVGQAGEITATTNSIPPTATSGPSSEGSAAPTTTSPAQEPLSLAVVGDSVMVSMLPGFRAAAAEHGWTLIEAAFPACPVGLDALWDDEGEISPYAEKCSQQVPAAYTLLEQQAPDVIYWHDLQSTLSRRSQITGELLLAGTPEWRDDLVAEWLDAVDRFTAAGSHVAVVMPPLRSQDDRGCAASVNVARCETIQMQDDHVREATRALEVATANRDDVTFVVLDDVLCPQLPCAAELEGVAVREGAGDQTHFTEEGARWLTDRLFDLFDPVSLGPARG